MRRLVYSSKRSLLAKLGHDGVVHYVLPLLVIVVFAVVGTAYLVSTHADTVSTPPNDPGTIQEGDNTADDGPVATEAATTDSTVIDNFSNTIAAANEPVSCAAQSFKHVTDSSGGNYWLNPDRYGGGYQCPQNTDGKTDFTVVPGGTIFGGNDNTVQAFPDIIRGCTNSGCITSGYPIQTSKVAHYYATSTLTGTASAGHWDYGYDLWFNKSDVVGPSSGTEIFVNLDRQNRTPPSGAGIRTLTNVTVGGRTYNVYLRRVSHKFGSVTHTWNFVTYWRTPAATSTGDMDLALFMTKTETIDCAGSPAPGGKCLSSGWFWTGVDTGTELWVHGTGLRVSGVRVEPTP